jgi:hypothetical protein
MAEEKEKKRVDKAVLQPSAGKATLWVSRSIRQHGTEVASEGEEQLIEVQKFLVEPAYVKIEKGLTLNRGNYEFVRVDVGLTLPCYVEEVDGAMEQCNRVVEARLMREYEEVDQWRNKKINELKDDEEDEEYEEPQLKKGINYGQAH